MRCLKAYFEELDANTREHEDEQNGDYYDILDGLESHDKAVEHMLLRHTHTRKR